jgi:hypothetical protein
MYKGDKVASIRPSFNSQAHSCIAALPPLVINQLQIHYTCVLVIKLLSYGHHQMSYFPTNPQNDPFLRR